MAISIFRYNRRRRHPAYIFKNKNGMYYYISLTHAPSWRNYINHKLYKNPNPNDPENSYVIQRVFSDSYRSFGRTYRNWRFDRNDKRMIKRIKKSMAYR